MQISLLLFFTLACSFLGGAECHRAIKGLAEQWLEAGPAVKSVEEKAMVASVLVCCCKDFLCRRNSTTDTVAAFGEDGMMAEEHRGTGQCCKRRASCSGWSSYKQPAEYDDVCGWPFKALGRRGAYSQELAPTARNLKEWKRDFARRTAPGSDPSFFVVTPERQMAAWSRSTKASGTQDAATADRTFEEFGAFLQSLLAASSPDSRMRALVDRVAEIAERLIGALSVSSFIDFAMEVSNTPPMPMQLKQPTFVLILTATGEVRVMLYAFVDYATSTAQDASLYLTKLLSEDLVPPSSEAGALPPPAKFEYTTCAAHVAPDDATGSDMNREVLTQVPGVDAVLASDRLSDLLSC
jgi:hypothetical protein